MKKIFCLGLLICSAFNTTVAQSHTDGLRFLGNGNFAYFYEYDNDGSMCYYAVLPEQRVANGDKEFKAVATVNYQLKDEPYLTLSIFLHSTDKLFGYSNFPLIMPHHSSEYCTLVFKPEREKNGLNNSISYKKRSGKVTLKGRILLNEPTDDTYADYLVYDLRYDAKDYRGTSITYQVKRMKRAPSPILLSYGTITYFGRTI